MSTYRLTDVDRETLRYYWFNRTNPGGLFAAVEAIIAPIHARAEAAEAEVARWQEKAQEAGASYGLANAKHHEELDRANRLERLADRLAEKAVDLEDRAWAAEKRADDLAAVVDRVRAELTSEDATAVLYGVTGTTPDTYGGVTTDEALHHAGALLTRLRALLPDDTKEADR